LASKTPIVPEEMQQQLEGSSWRRRHGFVGMPPVIGFQLSGLVSAQ